MPAKFLGFVIRAALVFAIAVIVCRTANAAPAKTADRALEGIFRQTGVLKAEPRSRIYTNLLPDGHVFFLLKDGTVFIVGDPDDSPAADREGSNRAELYETAAGAFVELGPLLHKRGGGCALTLLNDGRVLVSGVSRSDAELFDPATRRFSPAGSMNNVHCGVDPLLLNDGTVLFAGNDFNRRGGAPQTIEIYHPPPR